LLGFGRPVFVSLDGVAIRELPSLQITPLRSPEVRGRRGRTGDVCSGATSAWWKSGSTRVMEGPGWEIYARSGDEACPSCDGDFKTEPTLLVMT
jgi:hypothetical protein